MYRLLKAGQASSKTVIEVDGQEQGACHADCDSETPGYQAKIIRTTDPLPY